MKFILNHFKKSMRKKNENVTGSTNNVDVDTDFVIICNICFIDVILVKYLGIISIFFLPCRIWRKCAHLTVWVMSCHPPLDDTTGRSPADKSGHFLVMVDTSPCWPGEGWWWPGTLGAVVCLFLCYSCNNWVWIWGTAVSLLLAEIFKLFLWCGKPCVDIGLHERKAVCCLLWVFQSSSGFELSK